MASFPRTTACVIVPFCMDARSADRALRLNLLECRLHGFETGVNICLGDPAQVPDPHDLVGEVFLPARDDRVVISVEYLPPLLAIDAGRIFDGGHRVRGMGR